MPSKNSIKPYVENSSYHIYNRGVEKRTIFLDEQDCHVFLRYMKLYLSPSEEICKLSYTEPRVSRFIKRNIADQLDLLSFALMPNHFHLQIFQRTQKAIEIFMRGLATSYVAYFNKKYKRIGPLFQGRYKAALIADDAQFIHLSRYIHLNHMKLPQYQAQIYRKYSSLPYYYGELEAYWLRPQLVLSFFKSARDKKNKDQLSYEGFIKGGIESSEEILQDFTLEQGQSMT